MKIIQLNLARKKTVVSGQATEKDSFEEIISTSTEKIGPVTKTISNRAKNG